MLYGEIVYIALDNAYKIVIISKIMSFYINHIVDSRLSVIYKDYMHTIFVSIITLLDKPMDTKCVVKTANKLTYKLMCEQCWQLDY